MALTRSGLGPFAFWIIELTKYWFVAHFWKATLSFSATTDPILGAACRSAE